VQGTSSGPDQTPAPPSTTDPFDAPDVVWRPVSPRLATARRILWAGVCLVPALAVVAAAVAMDLGPLAWLALVPLAALLIGWWMIGRQVSAWAYAERREELLFRSGRVLRNLTVVPYGRLQFVDVQAGPLARAFGLASVQLHTASASTDARIPGLATAEAARLRDRLAERGEAQLAGL